MGLLRLSRARGASMIVVARWRRRAAFAPRPLRHTERRQGAASACTRWRGNRHHSPFYSTFTPVYRFPINRGKSTIKAGVTPSRRTRPRAAGYRPPPWPPLPRNRAEALDGSRGGGEPGSLCAARRKARSAAARSAPTATAERARAPPPQAQAAPRFRRKRLARPEGFEPSTCGLEVRRSVRLS